jgi:hypothetical protein
MESAGYYLEMSAHCFREATRPQHYNRLELKGLTLLGHALWEKSVELDAERLQQETTEHRAQLRSCALRSPPDRG